MYLCKFCVSTLIVFRHWASFQINQILKDRYYKLTIETGLSGQRSEQVFGSEVIKSGVLPEKKDKESNWGIAVVFCGGQVLVKARYAAEAAGKEYCPIRVKKQRSASFYMF